MGRDPVLEGTLKGSANRYFKFIAAGLPPVGLEHCRRARSLGEAPSGSARVMKKAPALLLALVVAAVRGDDCWSHYYSDDHQAACSSDSDCVWVAHSVLRL